MLGLLVWTIIAGGIAAYTIFSPWEKDAPTILLRIFILMACGYRLVKAFRRASD